MNAPLAKEQIALLMSDSLTYRSAVVPGTDGTVPASRPTLADRIASMVAYVRDLPRRRAVLNELDALSDRELADIGLVRADLSRVFDPAFNDARRA